MKRDAAVVFLYYPVARAYSQWYPITFDDKGFFGKILTKNCLYYYYLRMFFTGDDNSLTDKYLNFFVVLRSKNLFFFPKPKIDISVFYKYEVVIKRENGSEIWEKARK